LTLPFHAHTRRGIVSSHPKNRQINHPIVQILNSDGKLSEPQKLTSILESVNLDTHIVRLYSSDPPTVVVASKIDEKVRKLEKRAQKKLAMERQKVVTKERQITWFTQGSDLQYKLQSIKDDLEKGNIRLDVQFLGKAGLKSPPHEEMMRRLDEVVAMFKETCNEWKRREVGKINATLFLQSTDKSKLTLPTKEELEEVAKQKLHLDRFQKKKEDKRTWI
jgi:translation initiation factor IF-3